MFMNLLTFALTAFISVNGQLVEVEKTSDEYMKYSTESVTDIGNTDNLYTTSEEVIEPTEEPIEVSTVSGGDAATFVVVEPNNDEEIALMSTMVDLLAENSDTATGTLNSSVLTLMDRMIDAYPSYYKYAGFRTDEDDSYASTLYISKSAEVNGNTITFGDDCVAVHFYRNTTNNYSGYLYFNTADSPYASVDVNRNTIVYTNCLDGYPALGTKSVFSEEWLWIGILAVAVIIIFTRRNNNG